MRGVVAVLLVAALAGAGAGVAVGSLARAPAAVADPATGPGPTLAFRSPSGNIVCAGDATSVRCDIAEWTFDPTTVPAECADGFTGAVVATRDRAAAPCTEQDRGEPPVLAYGGTAVAGDVRCASAETGVTCTVAPTGHGFALSRDQLTTF